MSFPRYPKYKASGVEWLGDVPEGWEVKPLRYVCYCLDGSRIPLNGTQRAEKQGTIPYWGANSIVDYVDEALFDEDLVFLGEDGAPFFDKSKPIAFFSTGKVWPNNHVHVLRPAFTDTGKFIAYALNATDYAHFIDGSTRDKLTQGAMKAIPVPSPPFPEQTAIAEFLDRETAKIDGLVAEQRRLMELLKEKRQAVISHAVTKGLNPHAPMKPSGIAWLGDVPVGWGVQRVKFAAKMDSGHTPSRAVPEYWENCTIPWVSLNDTKTLKVNDYIEETAIEISELGMANSSAHLISAGSVVFTRDATIGLTAILTRPMAVSQHVITWTPNPTKLTPEFLLRVFGAMEQYLDSFTMGSTIKTIGMPDVRKLTFALPPLDEQIDIVAFIGEALSRLDTLTAEAQRAIDLLQERRTALISAAVTGQIDVRQ